MNFTGKTLMITGGTGSFGNQMLKHFIANTDIKEVRIYSRDEEKQDAMRSRIKDERIKYFIGDVRNASSINDAMRGVDFVFHAAALKQVPSCEFFPMEAVKTNIIGANNVIEAAISNNVKNMIVLSTDKAVAPVNTMGMTKAIMEKLIISKSRNLEPESTTLCATRYGNVMASRGSVIPIFVNQAKNNQPLTITDPKMTRFLMSLEESVKLVLFAFEHGKPGDTFIQKSPACTIETLAQAVVKLFKSKSSINVIGPRHGEKAFETLVGREELQRAEDLGDFYRVPADVRDLNYSRYLQNGDISLAHGGEYNSDNTVRLDIDGVINKLLSIEYIQKELNY